MSSSPPAPPSTPTPHLDAAFDDLDLEQEEGREVWRKRHAALSTARLAAARARLEGLGLVDAQGRPASTELPVDMLPTTEGAGERR